MQKPYGNYQPTAPLVVKLGGSLYERVPDLIPVLRDSPRPLFIVPGGGRFADAVREAALPDDDAHWRAVKAMDQYGEYVGSSGLPTTDRMRVPERTTVFLPFRCTRQHDPLPHTWDVTSDTLAAWVADVLGLDLLILKSIDGIVIGRSRADRITEPVTTDVVDPCCIPYILDHRIRATIINGSRGDSVARFLRGEPVPGTQIGTTF